MWNESLMIGSDVIDADHRQIIELIDELRRYFLVADPGESAGTIMARLVTYTKEHFAREEALMAACPDYTNIEAHKSAHGHFIATINKNISIFEISGEISADMPAFLYKWWVNHINGTDRKFINYLT